MHGTAPHPILAVLAEQGRMSTWLARKTGYRPEYLSRIFNKRIPATATVRAACAKALGLPESELFDLPVVTEGAVA